MSLPIHRPTTSIASFHVSRYEAAERYERARADLDALPAKAVGCITVRVATVIAIAFGA